MKRVAAFILLMIYFVTSTGATMHYHFCMGKMAGFSLLGNKEEKCGKCGMDTKETEDNGCCKDEQQWVKIKDDQKRTTSQFEFSKLQIEVISFVFFNDYLFASQVHHPFVESKVPLRGCELATYLFICVFRI